MDVLRREDGDDDKYISAAAIKSTLGVSSSTLRSWAESGRVAVVRFGGNNKRLYKRSDVESMFRGYRPRTEHAKEAIAAAKRGKARICYARVSSAPQKDDLERHVKSLQEAYPEHEIIKNVASGINWKRPGLLSILDRAMRGDVQEVVVAHKDRMCRFAFELIEHVLERAGCKVVVQHQGDDDDDNDGGGRPGDESELRDDLLAIVTVFVASNNGKRSAANRRARKA
jgi:predicted site-specific integrase-resolvase